MGVRYLNGRVMCMDEKDVQHIVNENRFIEPIVDKYRNATETFLRMLDSAGQEACLFMEDDIILCDNFTERVLHEINKRPDDVIQFFSMRKDDLTIGSRYITGSKYLMNQCFYLPKGMAKEILEFAKDWKGWEKDPTGLDTLIASYLKSKKLRYWNVCPNLVDHKVQKSRIDSRRSSKRQSLTFER